MLTWTYSFLTINLRTYIFSFELLAFELDIIFIL